MNSEFIRLFKETNYIVIKAAALLEGAEKNLREMREYVKNDIGIAQEHAVD